MHVWSPGAGTDNLRGTKFWLQQKAFVTSIICWKAPEQGQTTLVLGWGHYFYSKSKLLFLRSFAGSFRRINFNSDFRYIFFTTFLHVYRPGADNSRAKIFGRKSKLLFLRSFAGIFTKINLNSDFVFNFFKIFYMYNSPGQGQKTSGKQFFDRI